MNFFNKVANELKGQDPFDLIMGRDTEKAIVKAALHASAPVHLLLQGPPGGSKTEFLKAVERQYGRNTLYLNFTSTSGPGAITDIVARRPKFLLIDEIEKASKDTRAVLLDLMENGRITYKLKNEKVDVTNLKIWVIATCNHIEKIKRVQPEFLDRMQVIAMKPYGLEEYFRVAEFRLTREGIKAELANYIANCMYHMHNSQDLRECVRVARMAKTQEDVDELVRHLEELQ